MNFQGFAPQPLTLSAALRNLQKVHFYLVVQGVRGDGVGVLQVTPSQSYFNSFLQMG